MNADTARGEVFGDELACEEARPAAFHPGTAEPERLRALGVCVSSDAAAAPGTTGLFRIQPSDWLPESLELPATVLASVTDGAGPQLWLRFGPLTPALESALERHLFRVHRRAIAESRRPR